MPGSLTCLRVGPEPKTRGSAHCGSLLLKQVEHLWKIVKACKDWERMKKDRQIIPIELQQLFGWLDGQALAAVLNETCIAELNFSRKSDGDAILDVATVQAWCCKSLTVPTLRSAAKCRSWRKLWRATATWRTWNWNGAVLKSKASRWGAWCGIRFQVRKCEEMN